MRVSCFIRALIWTHFVFDCVLNNASEKKAIKIWLYILNQMIVVWQRFPWSFLNYRCSVWSQMRSILSGLNKQACVWEIYLTWISPFECIYIIFSIIIFETSNRLNAEKNVLNVVLFWFIHLEQTKHKTWFFFGAIFIFFYLLPSVSTSCDDRFA